MVPFPAGARPERITRMSGTFVPGRTAAFARTAVALAALLPTAPSTAEDACAADAARLCAGANQTRTAPFAGPGKGGSVEVLGCLRANQSKLTAACQQQLAAALHKAEDVAVECEGDANRLCADVEPGNGRVAACLVQKQSELSQSCQGAINTVRLKTSQLQAACAADVNTFCTGIEMGGGRLVACLRGHLSEISGDCRDALSKW